MTDFAECAVRCFDLTMKRKLIPIWLRLLTVALIVLWLGAGLSVLAVGSVKNYSERLFQAEQLIDPLIDGEPAAAEIVATMQAVKQLIPAEEDIETDGQVIRANNSWLHAAADLVVKNAYGDEEQVRSMLIEMADRLLILEQRVTASTETVTAADQRAQLEKILARSEYLPEEKKDSVVKKWARKAWDQFTNLLAKLFGNRSNAVGNSGTGSVSVVRLVVILVLLAAASFGLVKLLQKLRRRRKKDDDDIREVLGEELPEDVTAADLLNHARQLAGNGDFRSAIRRAYVASLCELEQRGKVRLHRAKTNRDYLDELKPETSLYPTFSVMTGAFEHVWYGQESATETEFNDFLTLYQEAVG